MKRALWCFWLFLFIFMPRWHELVQASGLDQRPINTTCLAPDRPTVSAVLNFDQAFPDVTFSNPVLLLQVPGDDTRWYILDQAGFIILIKTGVSEPLTFLDIQTSVSFVGERGLLGMAFHPNYPTTPFTFIYYTDLNGDSVIARFTVNPDGDSLDPSSEQVVLTVSQPYANHNGGHMAFGSDDYLYIGLGDGGSGGDPLENGQNIHTLLGSMLRINVDGDFPYSIPPDNPFATSPGCLSGEGCPEIYAWGLRNPWRWSFDRDTGELWVADVGQLLWEEVNLVQLGDNCGWRCYEGFHEYNTAGCDLNAVYRFPVTEYSHTLGRCSVTGGYVYRGSSIPALQGIYLYADYCTGEIWGLYNASGIYTPQLLADAPFRIVSFGQDNAGELYVLGRTGEIMRLVEASAPPPSTFPQILTDTGYVDTEDATVIADCFIPYAINVPFWSDGADKRRWLAIPDDTYIHINPDGDWAFPPGTVLMKEFTLGGKRIETRIFVRHFDGGWAGYTYEWNDQETDAILLSAAKMKVVNNQLWYFPDSNECLSCHTPAAGFALGPENIQMNRDFTYPSTNRTDNQLATFDAISMFDPPLQTLPSDMAALPEINDTTVHVRKRAKAYLHSNCSNCHRPGGGARGAVDFRYATRFQDMNVCGVAPETGDLGIPGALLLAPGDPPSSLIPERMSRLDPDRMPPLASNVVDTVGVDLMDAWILTIRRCAPNALPWLLLLLP
jgi:uncharacterized repeat protein (TIGR03806 family)